MEKNSGEKIVNKILQENSFIKIDNTTICYKAFGNPKHPCIILIMGIEGQLINWPEELTQGLANQGFYVITFDNRDVGLSSYYDQLETPDIFSAITDLQQGKIFRPPYTLNDMTSDIIKLMDSLQINKAHIAGISMGGMLAQIFALEYPTRVLSLIVIATTSGDPDLPSAKPAVMNYFFKPKKPVEDIETYVSSKINLYKIYNHPDHFNEEKIRKLAVQAYQRAYHPQGFKRHLLAMIVAEPRGAKLKQLKIPSLIIHGDYDPVFPIEHGQQLAQCLLNSQLVIIKKMGHGLPECLCPKLVEVIANFINKAEKNHVETNV